MFRALWKVVRSLVSRNTEEGDEEGFVPSPLDRSVRYSHGGPDDEIEREFYQIKDRARELEENKREH